MAAPGFVGEYDTMILWPAVALIGFLVLTALVIAMGTRSTALYEREKQTAGGMSAPEPVGAVAA